MAARIAAVTRHCMQGSEEEFQDVLRSFFVGYPQHVIQSNHVLCVV